MLHCRSTSNFQASLTIPVEKNCLRGKANMSDNEVGSTASSGTHAVPNVFPTKLTGEDLTWSSPGSDSTGSLRDFVVSDDEALGEELQSPPPRHGSTLARLEENVEALERSLKEFRIQLRFYRMDRRASGRISFSACRGKASDSSDTLISDGTTSDGTASPDIEESGTHSGGDVTDNPFTLRSTRRLKDSS